MVRAYAFADRTLGCMRRLAFVALVGGALALGACAQPGYSASKLQRELVRAGVSEEQAKCVTAKFEEHFDLNSLASHSDPAPGDDQLATQLLRECGVKNLNPPSPPTSAHSSGTTG